MPEGATSRTSKWTRRFLVTSHQESTRGQARKTKKCVLTGFPFKWCPVDDCEVVTHLMRSHLTHKHRLKPGPLLENDLRVVMKEIELARTSTRPPTHTITSASATTSACISSPSPPTVHSTDSAMESQDIEEDITTE